MRIAHVTSGLARSAAGVRETVMALSREQQNLGHEVVVFGLNSSEWADDAGVWRGAPAKAFDVRGPRALGYAPEMVAGLAGFDPDIVHLHALWMHPGRSVLQWHRRSGKPFILSPHGMLSPVALRFSPLKKRLVRWLFQDAVFDAASAIHVTSENEAREVRDFGIESLSVVFPNGVPKMDRPEGCSEGFSSRVLFLGRLHPIKGLDILIRAWALLGPEFPEWQLDITGPDEGGELARLKQLVAELGLRSVCFGPPVFGDQKIACMADAEIFALPSLSENFAITVAESLMLEVPVVVSKGAPWSGVEANKCGYWVEIGVEPMAEGLRKLMLASSRERRSMGRNGREWIQREFSWPIIAAGLITAYRRVLGLP